MADAVYHLARLVAGDPKPVRVAGTVAAEIKAGDFVVLTSNKAIRASSLSDSGTKAQNQEAAHDVFLGVALTGKLANETADILVGTEGDYVYPCSALGQAYDVGSYFGGAGTGSAGAVGISDTTVEPVATANLAFGTLAEPAASGATSVKVRIAGVLTTPYRGCQAMA